jgi:hypothetical protein
VDHQKRSPDAFKNSNEIWASNYRLVLEPEIDSNLIWIGPPTWLGRPCSTPKVVVKEEDVLRHLLGVLYLLGACSNLGLGPKCE